MEKNPLFLDENIEGQLEADREWDRVLDYMLGTGGTGTKFVDITDSNGSVIKEVPFVKDNFLLPSGIETKNGYFNNNKYSHDNSHLN